MAKPHHNGPHPRVRALVAREVSGATTCVLCGQVNCPKTGVALLMAWDLAHDDDRSTETHPVWLGPAHPYCNRSKARESFRYRGHHRLKATTNRVVSRGLGRVRRVALGEIDE
jgi:hypothetical protein